MNIIQIRNYILAVLLGFAAMTMLPACSSTEEAPPPEETGDTCDCPAGDIQCLDRCEQNI
jgi:hypothetical protein